MISTLGPCLLSGKAVLWWAWISPNLGNRWAWSTYRNMHKRPANINNSTDGRSTEQTKLHTEKQVLVSESVPTKHAERHEYCIAFAKVTVPRTHTFSAMPGKASPTRTCQMAILDETGSKSYCFHRFTGCLQQGEKAFWARTVSKRQGPTASMEIWDCPPALTSAYILDIYIYIYIYIYMYM